MIVGTMIGMLQRRDDGFDDPFYAPDVDPGAFYGPHIDLWLLIVIGVMLGLLLALGALAFQIGRQRGLRTLQADREASAEAIYASVKLHLNRALKTSGGLMLERGREVGDILEARLGYVLALTGKPGKAIQALDDALAGKAKAEPHTGHGPAKVPAKVKVALATEAHYLEVWKALQALSRFWDDKPKVLAMIAAAQTELALRPKKEIRPFRRKAEPVAVAVAATIGAALHDANAAGEVIPQPDPAPAPAPKTGGKGRKLPAHKRNMLA